MGSEEKKFDFPKAELHCHLDGSFRIKTVAELAKSRGIHLPTYDVDELASKHCIRKRTESLHEYLTSFLIFTPAFAGHGESIARITREAIEDKAKEGVRYIEFRYSPHLLADRDVTPIIHSRGKGNISPREVVEVIHQASIQPQKDYNIEVRFILCCMLDHPNWSIEVAKLCKEFANKGVVGMDIAGSGHEGGVIEQHVSAFEFCKENNVHVTVHAGEAGPAKEVENAMNLLHAERIGHGYKVVDDESIYEKAKMKKIHFEVCPLSSNLTASVDIDPTRHPAIRFMKEKVNFSLNTDNPGIQNSKLLEDYDLAKSTFGFTCEEMKTLNLNALRSAFCEDDLKQRLIKEFQDEYKTVA